MGGGGGIYRVVENVLRVESLDTGRDAVPGRAILKPAGNAAVDRLSVLTLLPVLFSTVGLGANLTLGLSKKLRSRG
jgi:hypothetical protein